MRAHDWRFEPVHLPSVPSLVDTLLGWCRASLAGCRRPYGIDHFDLAIAYRVGDSGVRHVYFKGLRPLSLYRGDLEEQLLSRLRHDIAPGAGALCISAACYSWGDAVSHALLQV